MHTGSDRKADKNLGSTKQTISPELVLKKTVNSTNTYIAGSFVLSIPDLLCWEGVKC